MEFTHAGSMETAAVLAFDPSLVHLDQATPPGDLAAGEAAHALFRRPDVYPVLRDFRQISPTGWYGRPERATAERAEQIAEAVADHVVKQAREIWAALPRHPAAARPAAAEPAAAEPAAAEPAAAEPAAAEPAAEGGQA
jgi:creatinine amidohydrolase/Fe(II)-dependent formamide hydrolase-like protein